MKRLMAAVVALVFVGLVGPVIAADNPTGTWKWTASFGGRNWDDLDALAPVRKFFTRRLPFIVELEMPLRPLVR